VYGKSKLNTDHIQNIEEKKVWNQLVTPDSVINKSNKQPELELRTQILQLQTRRLRINRKIRNYNRSWRSLRFPFGFSWQRTCFHHHMSTLIFFFGLEAAEYGWEYSHDFCVIWTCFCELLGIYNNIKGLCEYIN